jgi:hypothetical protein
MPVHALLAQGHAGSALCELRQEWPRDAPVDARGGASRGGTSRGALADATKATLSARARASKPRKDWRPAFLDGFRNAGTVAGGCAQAGIARTTAYRARQRDESFALAWSDVEEDVTDKLEGVTLMLALAGDVNLLKFMLQARKPDVYRDRPVLEHTGPDDGPIRVEQFGDLSKLSDRDLASLQRILDRADADDD